MGIAPEEPNRDHSQRPTAINPDREPDPPINDAPIGLPSISRERWEQLDSTARQAILVKYHERFDNLTRDVNNQIDATEIARARMSEYGLRWFLVITCSSALVAILNVVTNFVPKENDLKSILSVLSAVVAVLGATLVSIRGRGNHDIRAGLQLEIHQLFVDLLNWIEVNQISRVDIWGNSFEAVTNAEQLLREGVKRESSLRKRLNDALK